MNRSPRWLFLASLALGSFALRADAQVISNSPNLPPANGAYVSPALAHQLYTAGLLTVDVFNIRHFGFSLSTPPPLLIGGSTIDTFDSVLTGIMSVNGGPAGPFAGNAHTQVSVQKSAGPDGPTGTFQTEMLQLDLVGLPGGAMIRESPTLQSAGQTSITDVGGGLFRIDSFFDVFTELSVDGGATWIPSDGPGRVTLQSSAPEPTSAVLVSLGLFSAAGWIARRKRAA